MIHVLLYLQAHNSLLELALEEEKHVAKKKVSFSQIKMLEFFFFLI